METQKSYSFFSRRYSQFAYKLFLLVVIPLIFILSACEVVKLEPVETVTLSIISSHTMISNSVRLKIGEEVTLKANPIPANIDSRRITWYNDSPNVIKVSDNGDGTATITALSTGDAEVKAEVGGKSDFKRFNIEEL